MKNLILGLLLIISFQSFAEDQDPLEMVNRVVFNFNSVLDRNIFEPIAKTYKKNTPTMMQNGVNNIFNNLKEVPTFFNQALQLKIGSALDTTMRFLFNSTIGAGGLLDVATEMGFKKGHEDFGQTLGFYGVPSGPYLVLPILGPSNLRDITSLSVDTYSTPELNLTTKEVMGKNIMFALDLRTKLLPQTELMYNSEDPYITARSSYLQNRNYLINDGVVEINDIDF